MHRRRKVLIAVLAFTAVSAVGTGTAIAKGAGGDTETAITGAALQKASAAALQTTGGGEVTDTEVGDEESYYEVEVTRQNGAEVDVQLDANFAVVATSADDKSGEDKSDGDAR